MTNHETAERLNDETTLSQRESEVAARRVEGETFREIADELGISPQNANKAWQRAKEKAATAKRSVELFRETGLIE